MVHKQIDVAGICLANDQPFVLFGGLNVLESRDLALSVADHFKQVTTELGIPFVFKASFFANTFASKETDLMSLLFHLKSLKVMAFTPLKFLSGKLNFLLIE